MNCYLGVLTGQTRCIGIPHLDSLNRKVEGDVTPVNS
jgi:hypothetical protein